MAKKTLKKGIFITFEGPEGSGKSTHAKLTADYLKKEGYDVIYTREPGGTKVGNEIRNVLLHLKDIEISPVVEMLLFEASRSEHINKIIKPALKKKKIVISDRFNDATIVYQGYAGEVPIEDVKKIESISIGNLAPDITILLDIDAKRGLGKIHRRRRDRMESKKISFHKRVRRGYLDLAKKNRIRIKIVKTKENKKDTDY